MKKIVLIAFLCSIMIVLLTGCSNSLEAENFGISLSLDNERFIKFAYDPQYKDTTVSNSISNNELTLKDFINSLELSDFLKDGGSKIYKYDSKLSSGFGDSDFYVIACNSLDGVRDIYVAKYKNNLVDKCSFKNEWVCTDAVLQYKYW